MLPRLALVLTLLAPGMAAAQGLPVIETSPEGLQPLDTMDASRPFTAVGRLETGNGFCTGTLIASDLVLTAAHCLFNEDGTRRADENFNFLAGFRNGRISAQRGLRESFVHPEYDYLSEESSDRVRTDIALLRLDAPITDGSVYPIPVGGSVGRNGIVDVVSYGRMREQVPSLEEDCTVLQRGEGVMVLTCDTIFGSSGAPVMIVTPSGHRIVSVVSSGAIFQGDDITLAAAVDGSINTLMQMAGARDPGRSVAGLAPVRTLTQDEARASSGARFIRP